MGYIFVSYSRKDMGIVDQLVDVLKSSGYVVQIDRDSKTIPGGALWERKIVAAIEGASVFFLILSPQSVKSEQVRKELHIACKRGIAIFPLEIQKTSLTKDMEFSLAGRQRIDLGTNWDDGVVRVLHALREKQKIAMEKRRRITQEGRKKLSDIMANPMLTVSEKVDVFSKTYAEEADKRLKPFLDKLNQLEKRNSKLTEELHKAFEDKSKLESDCEQLMRNEQTPNRILKLTENEVERLRKKIKLLLNETVVLSEEQVKTFEAVTQLGEEEDHLTSNILEEANQKVCEIFGSSGISLDKKP
jgi:hypothetical protein